MAMQLPSSRGKGRRTPMAEINVTPLVDVMLVLLIIFMVTAPLLTTGVPVNLPDSRAKGLEQEQEPVQLSLAADGSIYLGDTPVSEQALPEQLARIVGSQPAGAEPRQVMLRADTALDYGRVMRVMGELNRAGLNRVALVSTQGDAP
ncbi:MULTISPECIES: protein TolR [Sphingomonas]|uniref:Protein TolR n=1 Tax=Sphingomonas molluscorum TaxID=418184 RepID=A0ABU8Q4J5_9SPHN|nr:MULTISPECIES: protein TolR [unclassified Sphingomonas]MBM7405535.1 biopolymer transport protein TolR [Sphingomonas sp. JUb134]MCG7348770.1 protein TolR [Sphingomonas sp. ACRSK]RSV17928.1 protein TolR [Sphingomonas sp. ABOLF]GLK20710.1 protein TolR [Microbacterium terregens]